MLTPFWRSMFCDYHCTVLLHQRSHFIPDQLTGTPAGYFGADGFCRLQKVKLKTFVTLANARNSFLGRRTINKEQSPFGAKKRLGYLSADIICSEKRTVFRQQSSRKAGSYEEQITSKGKYPSIFSPHWRLLSLLSFKSFSQRAQF